MPKVSNKDKNHDLFDFMSQITQEMASEYERIRKRATEDPGTAGDQGEENWARLLRDWLPTTYQVVTKGRIINHEGKTSPQIDVLILKASYPKKLHDKKVYLSAGVAAAFECKITLTAQHINDAIETCTEVKKLYAKREGSPYKELHSPIIYGLLAHSHIWKNAGSKPFNNIENKLVEGDKKYVKHPNQILDLLCVADLATWNSFAISYIGPHVIPPNLWSDGMASIYGPDGSACTSYMAHQASSDNQITNFTPIGALITYLSEKLAWENPEFQSLADYYRLTNVGGSGEGEIQLWDKNIYSANIQSKLGRLSNGIPWDEWSIGFS